MTNTLQDSRDKVFVSKSFSVGVRILADDKAHVSFCLGVLVREMTKLPDVSMRSPWNPLAGVQSKGTQLDYTPNAVSIKVLQFP